MATSYSLRRMAPTDGPAMDALLRAEPPTQAFRLTTRYRVDVYQALLAQHPEVIGVVAESEARDGLVGMATAFFGQVRSDDRAWPSAFLENLKVHHESRRQGIGGALAAWRIDEASRRFDGDGLILTGVESSNVASLATAARWATQVLGPLRIVIGRTTSRPPRAQGLDIRPPTAAELEMVVVASDRYHEDHALHPAVTAEGLAPTLAPTAPDLATRGYRIVVAPGGRIVAGAAINERFVLMEDHLEHVPLPMRVIGRLTGLLPADGIIRSLDVSLGWHAPDRLDAAVALWDAIRWEWRGRCTNVNAVVDPRTTLAQAFTPARGPGPRPELMVPVRSPVPIDADRPLDLWR